MAFIAIPQSGELDPVRDSAHLSATLQSFHGGSLRPVQPPLFGDQTCIFTKSPYVHSNKFGD